MSTKVTGPLGKLLEEQDAAMAEREALRSAVESGTATPVDEGPAKTIGKKVKIKLDALAKRGEMRLTDGELADLEILEARRAGRSVSEIASETGLTLEVVKSTIERCLRTYVREMQGAVEEIRLMEVYRLDGVLEKLWPRRDDPRVVDSILKIMDRKSKLLGLDAVEKSEIKLTGFETLSDEEIAAQIKNLAALAAAEKKEE